MPYNGSGTFTQIYNWNTESVTPPIEIAKLETECQDMATALTNCITRDGQGKPSAAIDFNAQNLTNVNNFSANGSNIYLPNYALDSFVNKLRNPCMEIPQRGTSGTILNGTASYNIDGWISQATGNTATWSQYAHTGTPTSRVLKSLNITGNTSITGLTAYQNIESLTAATFAGQKVIFSFDIYNNTGASITPTVTASYPTAIDNFASVTADLATTSLPSISNAVWTRIAFAFDVNVLAQRGYQILLNFGAAINTNLKSVWITGYDFRIANGAPNGIISSNIPICATRPIGIEMPLNLRYYEAATYVWNGYIITGALTGGTVNFAGVKRAAPTMTTVNNGTPTNFPSTASTTSGVSTQIFNISRIANGTGAAGFADNWTASAELL